MMKVWDLMIESDEGYWVLTVRTEDCDDDRCEFRFQLPAEMAEQLHKRVELEIDPWVQEMLEAKAAYQRGDPRWKPRDQVTAEAQAILDSGAYADDPAKRMWAEQVARGEIEL